MMRMSRKRKTTGRRDAPQRPDQRSDQRPGTERAEAPASRRPQGAGRSSAPPGRHWLFGRHAVLAALANPARRIHGLVTVGEPDADLLDALSRRGLAAPDRLEREALQQLLPPGAVHQGLALACKPLAQPDLETFLRERLEPEAILVVLDQITDPQNVGAILRSAAAFGAAALLTTIDRAPDESGTLAKAASGALEVVPYLRETNLARALDRLKKSGFWCLGLDEAGQPLSQAPRSERMALVMGAEGEGLRRLTKEHCDALLRLPTRPPIGTLNVSNAAAVALYELAGRQAGP